MKSRAGLSGHLATDRSKICEIGIVAKSASHRTPGGYDLIQGAAGMTYSYPRERTASAELRSLYRRLSIDQGSSRSIVLTRVVRRWPILRCESILLFE